MNSRLNSPMNSPMKIKDAIFSNSWPNFTKGWLFFAALGIGVGWSEINPAQAAEVWKVASLEWPPFSGAKLPDGGSGIKALRDSLKENGIDLVVEYFPWARISLQASTPDFVGFYPAWPEDVVKGYSSSATLFKSPLVIAQNKKSPLKTATIDDLKGKYVAVVQGYGNTKEFNDMVAKGVIIGDSGPDDITGVKKLEAGRVDAMVIDRNVLNYILKFEIATHGKFVFEAAGWTENKDLLVAVNNNYPNKERIILLLNKIGKAGRTQKMVDTANKAIFR
jgi:polar amino acid transport system substrate-binding protein